MFSFSEYLLDEMARMVRNPMGMDQGDIDYLQQFPEIYWTPALTARYSNLLLKAIGPDGELKPDWEDVLPRLTLTTGGRRTMMFHDVNTGMSKLVEKLKNQGYDLRDPDPVSKTLAGQKLMSAKQATLHMQKWKKETGEARQPPRTFTGTQIHPWGQRLGAVMAGANPDLQPGFSHYTPNKLERGEDSYEDPQDADYKTKWENLKPGVLSRASQLTDAWLQKLSQPDNPYHINHSYWIERRDQIIRDVVKRIHDNLKDPNIESQRFRTQLMQGLFSSIQQTGHLTRRIIVRAATEGIDINDLLQKGYSPQQVVAMVHDHLDGIRDKGGRPSPHQGPTKPRRKTPFSPNQEPHHKTDMDTLAAATPDPSLPFRANTIGAKRANATAQNMGVVRTGQEPRSRGDNYTLAPDRTPPPQRRAAARDVSDGIYKFADWLKARGKVI